MKNKRVQCKEQSNKDSDANLLTKNARTQWITNFFVSYEKLVPATNPKGMKGILGVVKMARLRQVSTEKQHSGQEVGSCRSSRRQGMRQCGGWEGRVSRVDCFRDPRRQHPPHTGPAAASQIAPWTLMLTCRLRQGTHSASASSCQTRHVIGPPLSSCHPIP